ncbi:hypothetical protein ACFWY6_00800 [Streptomyces sp. NPDC059037]|uniref:hypothetical protein n=1 Tax=Streptomyces sp. NPDC059037 TaxID=3346710 RepID=UPI0036C4E0CD
MDTRTSADGIFPERFWTYLTSEVMPAAREAAKPFESAQTEKILVEISTPSNDTGTVGRLLDYVDFQFRWALAVEPLLSEESAYAKAIGFPFRISPANFKEGIFQITSLEVGSVKAKLIATAEALTVLMGALTTAAVTFTAVMGMSPYEFTIEQIDSGKPSDVHAPALPKPHEDQVDQFCFSPAPFEIVVDITLSDGHEVRVCAKVPQGNSLNTDRLYSDTMREAASFE